MADSVNGTSVGRPSTSTDGPVTNGTSAPMPAGAMNKATDNVLQSDIGINVLLTKLKQSIASARDFSTFLKRRSALEEDHSMGMRKLARSSESASRGETRQGSYGSKFASVTALHERMADNGVQFAQSLLQMHEDLNDLATNMDRSRKHWKQEGLNNEKRVKDAESAMEKAKARYDSAAQGYERAKTGDSSGKTFGIKGPKSAEQREEDLLRKAQGADQDYKSKVEAAQLARKENLDSLRPRALRELQELIRECDSALVLQLQKFANFNERLIVGDGMVVSPMVDSSNGSAPSSMRDLIQGIDNDQDFHMFVTSHSGQLPPKPSDINYQKHSALGGTGGPISPTSTRPRGASQSANSTSGGPLSSQPAPAMPKTATSTSPTTAQTPSSNFPPTSQPSVSQGPPTLPPVSTSSAGAYGDRQPSASSPKGAPPPSLPLSDHSRSTSQSGVGFQQGRQQQPDRSFRGPPSGQAAPPYSAMGSQPSSQKPSISQPTPVQQPYRPAGAPPSGPVGNAWNDARQQPSGPGISHPPRGSSAHPSGLVMGAGAGAGAAAGMAASSTPTSATTSHPPPHLQPYNRVFGMKLDELFRRDDSAVPLVVYQCIQAVDLFGLDTEGIYRTNGNANHINQLKARFDHDSSKIDFRDPEAFLHDVNSVAGLLKTFLRELPDPLFTAEHYQEFIEAASIDDATTRRDSIHAVINALPDPNYATIRAIVLHLSRVQEHSDRNRMTTQNLAICFAPTMMSGSMGLGQGRHTGLQTRVVETVLINTYMIFDED